MKRTRETPGYSLRIKRHRDSQVSESSKKSMPVKELIKKRVDKAVNQCFNSELNIRSTKLQNTEKIVPDYDPDNRDLNIKSWIKKIEQLGVIYHWNDETKSFILISKLQGQARQWFNRLDSYDYSWEEWKSMIIRAFPRHHDYASLLDELMSRKKLPTESMTKYFQEKLAMCYRCQLSDQAAVSCIVRGLPQELRANAQAFQCHTPDELYEGFLCAFDSYQNNSQRTQNFPVKAVGLSKALNAEGSTSQLENTNTRKTPVCYRCNEIGHVATTCKLPDKRRCFRCGKLGHVASTCTADGEQVTYKKVQLLSNLNDVYKKNVRVNDVHMKAYIDTGSELNVINKKASDALKLKVKPTNTVLKGFNNCSVRAIGEVEFDLLVDNEIIKTSAVVTDVDLGNFVLIIGQTIINREDVMLSVSKYGVTLSKVPNIPNDLMNIDMCDEASCFRVELIEDTVVPIGDNLVRVKVNGADLGNYCTKPRRYSMGKVVYAIASTVLKDGDGYVRVCNIGSDSIIWKKGMTIARAEKCTTNLEDGRL
ncbi:uncharacterized protein LOC124542684 [Vanessa cardui]|uniref:uncharacterized protein LOC124542684 n=1 Tax=Vanessa cardui TaxID=171605 RepID=UPI001F12C8B0|nr:uncharacterized protein LOC124542684 [Vanessa cardui]